MTKKKLALMMEWLRPAMALLLIGFLFLPMIKALSQ
jgi:hypothetical protein